MSQTNKHDLTGVAKEGEGGSPLPLPDLNNFNVTINRKTCLFDSML